MTDRLVGSEHPDFEFVAAEPTPSCAHPGGTTLGHVIPPTEMWAIKSSTGAPIWYCPDCLRKEPRAEVQSCQS